MIANIKTRVDFGGIVNYANDQKNKKKSATLLAHEGVCTVSNKTIADSFQIQASMRPKVKSPVTRFFSLLTARCGSFPQR
mgnify:CR=1 FL=1